jgi:hypothetical protein
MPTSPLLNVQEAGAAHERAVWCRRFEVLGAANSEVHQGLQIGKRALELHVTDARD